MIDADLWQALKRQAMDQGKTLQQVTNDLLRQAMARRGTDSDYALNLEGWEAVEQSGVDICDRDKIFDLMDGR